MTKREYYELLVRSATDGTFPSVDLDGSCRYRKDNTPDCKQRCAAGLLIPDDNYNPVTEGKTTERDVVRCRLEIPDGINSDDLLWIQRCHDRLAEKTWDAEKFVQSLWYVRCFEEYADEPVVVS